MMIKFDLEKALAGDRVVTRDGREVTQLHFFTRVSNEYLPLVGTVAGEYRYWFENGCAQTQGYASFNDLFMAPNEVMNYENQL